MPRSLPRDIYLDACTHTHTHSSSLKYKHTQVGLVPTACGGTNLFEQWAPGGLLWSNMVDSTLAAMQAVGPRGRLSGIIWIQVGGRLYVCFDMWLSAHCCALCQRVCASDLCLQGFPRRLRAHSAHNNTCCCCALPCLHITLHTHSANRVSLTHSLKTQQQPMAPTSLPGSQRPAQPCSSTTRVCLWRWL